MTAVMPPGEDFLWICLMIAAKPETGQLQDDMSAGVLLYFHGYLQLWNQTEELL